MHDTNRELLASVARLLGPLLDELVFVGGCVTGLLITDEAVPGVRATIDVDAIAGITSYHEYVKFAERLRGVGFTEDASEGAPLCRWKNGGLILDVMPLDEKILGFSNRWYKGAMEFAKAVMIEPSLQIRIINAPYFLATKLEAFKGRGAGNFFGPDMEDTISVIDGCPALLEEVRAAPEDLRAYLELELRALLGDARFIDALAGHLLPDAANQSRIAVLMRRIQQLAGL